MLTRTHLAISLIAILLLVGYVNPEDRTIFIGITLLATLLPDVDTAYSKLGKYKIFRPLQIFVEHRGLIHSFTFLILVTFAFVFVYPVVSLPLFLGYSIHLFSDSFTIEGIRPFYPWSKTISWKIKTGGKTETVLFLIFLLCIIFLLLQRYTNVF
jgi:membrane-bound metal-dependent hydrolase YbcI (DUF457 family)